MARHRRDNKGKTTAHLSLSFLGLFRVSLYGHPDAVLSRARALPAYLAVERARAHPRQALAAIYQWFTEGFDTPDLVEARALLQELGAAG